MLLVWLGACSRSHFASHVTSRRLTSDCSTTAVPLPLSPCRLHASAGGSPTIRTLPKRLLLHAGLLQLASLTRLRSLVLWNCMRVTMDGLEVFRHLRALSDLSLRGCSQLPDALCYPVAHLHALTRLDLRNCERFTGA